VYGANAKDVMPRLRWNGKGSWRLTASRFAAAQRPALTPSGAPKGVAVCTPSGALKRVETEARRSPPGTLSLSNGAWHRGVTAPPPSRRGMRFGRPTSRWSLSRRASLSSRAGSSGTDLRPSAHASTSARLRRTSAHASTSGRLRRTSAHASTSVRLRRTSAQRGGRSSPKRAAEVEGPLTLRRRLLY
jgi:hypothetical protein